MSEHSNNGAKGRAPGVPPRVSVILDDMRWEEKLKVARARRAEILAQKAAEAESSGAAVKAPVPAPKAWAAATAAPIAMRASAPPKPYVEEPQPDDQGNNRKIVIAALAASVAVVAVIAGGALTQRDSGQQGGFAALFRAESVPTPDTQVAALGRPAAPGPLDQPGAPGVAAELSPADAPMPRIAALTLPDAPAGQPDPLARLDGNAVQVASLAPLTAGVVQGEALPARPEVITDGFAAPNTPAPSLPTAATDARPGTYAPQDAPAVQDAVLAFAEQSGEVPGVTPLSEAQWPGVPNAPQALATQGEAEFGWSPAVGLGVALPIRLSVFVPSDVDPEPVAAVVATVEAETQSESSIGTVDFAVSRTHVRYYRDVDLAAAERVAALTGGQLRDFTGYSPLPPEGTVELWMKGAPEQPARDVDRILASLQPVPAGAVAAVQPALVPATGAPVPAPTSQATSTSNLNKSFFGGNGVVNDLMPSKAPAAAPAPPQPKFRSFKSNTLLGKLTGASTANASGPNVKVRVKAGAAKKSGQATAGGQQKGKGKGRGRKGKKK